MSYKNYVAQKWKTKTTRWLCFRQLWPCRLTFWPQNLISKSTNPIEVHLWWKLGNIPLIGFWDVVSVFTWFSGRTDRQTHSQTHRPGKRMPPAPKVFSGEGITTSLADVVVNLHSAWMDKGLCTAGWRSTKLLQEIVTFSPVTSALTS